MMTAGEFAEILHAGWAAIPQSHSNSLLPTEAVVMALQAMERKAREFQRVDDRAAKEQFAPPGFSNLGGVPTVPGGPRDTGI